MGRRIRARRKEKGHELSTVYQVLSIASKARIPPRRQIFEPEDIARSLGKRFYLPKMDEMGRWATRERPPCR